MIRPGIGQPVTRREDKRFLIGAGRYVDDVPVSNAAHAIVVRSPHAHAHAHVRSIDIADAQRVEGVLAVLTGEDVAADGLGGLGIRGLPSGFGGANAVWPTRPILALGRVRYVGDPVALVIAETIEAAKDAAERVEASYDVLPAMATPDAAVSADAVAIWDEAPGNISFRHEIGDAVAVDAAMAKAAHVVNVSIDNNRLSANPIEPRGAIGEYDPIDERYTLRTSAQNPHRVREILADSVFGIPETDLRVVAGDVGGGFGMKGPAFPEEALVLWAARRVGRPVKWIAERGESFISDAHARDQHWEAELALDQNGKILAVRARADFALGAYLVGSSHVTILLATEILPSVYRCPAVHIATRGVFTNATPTSPYRGAGQPEAIYVMERLIERAAEATGLSSEEIRRRNYIEPEAMPYTTQTDQVYDGGEFDAVTTKAISLADQTGFASRREEAERNGKLRGFGISYFIEITAIQGDRMEIRFDPSGSVTVLAGTFSHGQGHETVFPQLVAEWLGVAMDRIRLVQGDTDRVAYGRGTFASRSMTIGGSALRAAADEVIAKGRRISGHILEAAVDDIEFAEGRFTVAGTDQFVTIAEVAKEAHAPMGLPPELGVGLEGQGSFAPTMPNYPNGCHLCEVEVDPETGNVDIVRYTAVDDVGRAINPLLLAGQVHGGVAQGIGQALLEDVVFDRESGQMLSASFLDYAMPRADDLPMIDFGHHDVPCQTNPLGVKGAGEAGCVGAPPAVMNAILDALKPLGVSDIAMPATPERVWRAIRNSK
jgi:aerobic carbon-monoxide dehydrogenase large subunit